LIHINDRQGEARIVEAAYRRLSPENCRIEISIDAQKAGIYAGDELAIQTPISSGRAGYATPTGDYMILEKKEHHESNVYGSWVRESDGEVVLGNVNSRKTPAPAGTVWKGTAMPYWQRLSWTGIGMHVGQLPGYPASAGCLRFPLALKGLIYGKTKIGTPVTVVQ
jgi:lipoprotein-anchoring transpeptidase ErfK/SrfK